MKVLVVPDVHGTSNWKVVKEIPESEYDYVVFLGDYFDNWENIWPEQGQNAIDLFEWVKEKPSKRKCVFGNHCFSYITKGKDGTNVSGHQFSHMLDISKILLKYYPYIDLVFEVDGWYFSHAGITNTWVNDLLKYFHFQFDKYPKEYYSTTHFDSQEEYLSKRKEWEEQKEIWDEKEFTIDFLNNYFHRVSHIIGSEFQDSEFDELLDWRGLWSSSGNEPMNSCLWVRPEALLSDAKYKNQVVGHTELCYKEEWVRLKEKDNNLIITDSKDHNLIQIFDTENVGEFLTIREFNKQYKIDQKNKQRDNDKHKAGI